MHYVLDLLRVSVALENAAEKLFSPHGISTAQFNVLNLLAAAPDGMKASELAAALVVDPSNVTGLLKRMSRDGLVADLEHREDRRARMVVLTQKGIGLWKRAHKDYTKALEKMESVLGVDEREKFSRLLRKVEGGVREHFI